MVTGLFFGTFNPVHRGHEALVHSFLHSNHLDDLWIIVTPSPPHKHVASLAPFEHRWNMLQLVFGTRSEVSLSDVEQRITPPHYTLKTLSYLKASYPDRSLILCIGGDSLQDLPNWFDYRSIGQKAELLVAERPGVSLDVPDELSAFSVHFCEHDPVEVSSTDIRERMASGHEESARDLHPEVAAYIKKHGLYREEKPFGLPD
ncbi:nicotinate (nicotinamide) nucleotide adenylyltransferase [Balneolales bacterium ANBcel1]|nr:nicotinate (nicotinamide) nucleotide adenylyltransferase [Balneolales bacterium ANBcel1]